MSLNQSLNLLVERKSENVFGRGYLAKAEFQKAKQVSKSLYLSQSRLFNNFFEYFKRGKKKR